MCSGQGSCDALHSNFESNHTFFYRYKSCFKHSFHLYPTAAKTQRTSLDGLREV